MRLSIGVPHRHPDPSPTSSIASVSNTGQPRLTINGAINVETLRAVVRFDDTVDATSIIALFQQLKQADPDAPRIVAMCDNARYYRSKAVAASLTTSRIQLAPLPPYCPKGGRRLAPLGTICRDGAGES